MWNEALVGLSGTEIGEIFANVRRAEPLSKGWAIFQVPDKLELLDIAIRNASTVAACSLHSNVQQAALHAGHQQTLILLLSRGNSMDATIGNAIRSASLTDFQKVLPLLVKTNIGVSALCRLPCTFQLDAVRDILLLQLCNSASAIMRAKVFVNAPCCKTSRMVMECLPDESGDVNPKGGLAGNVIHLCNNNPDVVAALLKTCANSNAQGKLFKDAVNAGSCNDDTVTMTLLLKDDADVNAQGNSTAMTDKWNKGLPPHSYRECENANRVAEMLRDRDIDSIGDDVREKTTLNLSTQGGCKDNIVKLVSGEGSVGSIPNTDDEMGLNFAVQEVHKDIIDHLLDSGINPSATDKYCYTSLDLMLRGDKA